MIGVSLDPWHSDRCITKCITSVTSNAISYGLFILKIEISETKYTVTFSWLLVVYALTNQLLSNVHSHAPLFQYLFINILPFWNICMCSSSIKYLTWILCKHRPFWLFCWLADYRYKPFWNTKFFVHEKLTNLLSRTFLYNFMREHSRGKKCKM